MLPGQSYPIRLRAVSDLGALRLDITGAVAATSRRPDATGGGNPTKRLRLGFMEPDDRELFSIATFLAQNRGVLVTRSKEFAFRPRPPAPDGGQTNTRRAMEETDVTHIHHEMQQSLYDSLVAAHGPDKVSCEGITSSGRPADIIVRLLDGYELFEIKTALAPRDCVRDALGQLLEYAYWPGSPGFNALWVVGQSQIDSETQKHLDGLRERFRNTGDGNMPSSSPLSPQCWLSSAARLNRKRRCQRLGLLLRALRVERQRRIPSTKVSQCVFTTTG